MERRTVRVPARCLDALSAALRSGGVPEPATVPWSRGAIALSETDCSRAEQLRFDTGLADAGYDVSTVFRPGLDAPGPG